MTPEPARPGHPFPRERFGALVRRLPRYGRLAWALSRHPKVTGRRRAALLASVVYLLSPIDLVPGFIPVVGQLDDAAAVLIGLSVALRSLNPVERDAALAAAKLTATDIETDLRTIGACYAWLGRSAARVTWRATTGLARGTRRVAGGMGARLRRTRRGKLDERSEGKLDERSDPN